MAEESEARQLTETNDPYDLVGAMRDVKHICSS